MNESKKPEHNAKALFVSLVSMIGMSAAQQLGGKSAQDSKPTPEKLQAAQLQIDLLDMLLEKTKGNLDAAEEKMLSDTAASLKLAYVAAAAGSEPPTAAAPEPRPSAADVPPGSAGGPAGKDKKFHKSYG